MLLIVHMAMHSYNLRSAKGTPTTTPISKLNPCNPTRSQPTSFQLQLNHVIGTTTKGPPGLSSCASSNTFAYCAGSVAVLAAVNDTGIVSRRYYRARPAVVPVNPPESYYATPNSTPTRKRKPLLTPRKEQEHATSSRILLENENAKTWTARERIKSVTCVALSPNGRYLAVGETGYNPRVLIYSTSTEAATELPLSIINEHSLGLKCVAFSPDSRYLATLGDSNDGFLFIWSVNSRSGVLQLLATNKCTTNVCHMAWCGQSLITVGTRHIKVWQMPWSERGSPRKSRLRNASEASPITWPAPLSGRNCLLGELADVTFTCVASISDELAVVGNDIDALCLIDVSKNPADFKPLGSVICPGGIVASRDEPQRLVWAGGGTETQTINLQDLLVQQQGQMTKHALSRCSRRETRSRAAAHSTLRRSLGLSQLSQTGTLALSCVTKHNVLIDTDSNLFISSTATDNSISEPTQLCSHNEPVIRGVQQLPCNSGLGAFLTWSKTGEVRFWGSDSELLRVEQIQLDDDSTLEDAVSNELIVLRLAGGTLLSGDRYGVVKVISCKDWKLLHTVRAHSAEIGDIAVDHASRFVATCSRDRMVQVFSHSGSSLDLLQTTDDHIAAVTQVCFSIDNLVLLSSSADRTIVVREKVSRQHGEEILTAFLQVRIITVKSSPLSMVLSSATGSVLYVSTLDRNIIKIDYNSGAILDSFKTADADSDDHAVLNDIKLASHRDISSSQTLLVACSSTDKSVRLYDLQKHAFITKESSHTQGVSAIAMFDNSASIGQSTQTVRFVSVGLDGTIMLWSAMALAKNATTPAIGVTQDQLGVDYESNSSPVKNSLAALPPLRKVLTQLDLDEFAKDLPGTPVMMRSRSPAARLRRMGSKPALTPSTITETDENIPPVLQRRASADDRTKIERRSPSPPAYATKRQKVPMKRGEVTKDFYTRQSEWLTRSSSPEAPQISVSMRPEQVANKARLRRPPSVPSDLRSRHRVPERRASTVVAPVDANIMSVASEQAVTALQIFRKRLQLAQEPLDLMTVEQELEDLLNLVRSKKTAGKTCMPEIPQRSTSSTQRLKLRRQNTAIPVVSAHEANSEIAKLASVTTSPTMTSDSSCLSGRADSSTTSPGVDGVTDLLHKVSLAGP